MKANERNNLYDHTGIETASEFQIHPPTMIPIPSSYSYSSPSLDDRKFVSIIISIKPICFVDGFRTFESISYSNSL